MKLSSLKKISSYPANPDNNVIKKSRFYIGSIKEGHIWNYHNRLKSELLSEYNGKKLATMIGDNVNSFKITEKNWDDIISGTIHNIYQQVGKKSNYIIVDTNPGEKVQNDISLIKESVKLAHNILSRTKLFNNIEVRYTGKRGFHLIGYLKDKSTDKILKDLIGEFEGEIKASSININVAKNYLEKLFSNELRDSREFTIKKPESNQIQLNLDLNKPGSFHIAKYSIRDYSGLCCVDLDMRNIDSFKREDGNIETVYKKLKGFDFNWDLPGETIVSNKYNQDELKPGFVGKFVIQSHDTNPKHWDLRLEFPVLDYDISLSSYEQWRRGAAKLFKSKYKRSSDNILRSWSILKQKLPKDREKFSMIETPDHAMEYYDVAPDYDTSFEISSDFYGSGDVSLVDRGRYTLLEANNDQKYVIQLDGDKVKNKIYSLLKKNGYWAISSIKNIEEYEGIAKNN